MARGKKKGTKSTPKSTPKSKGSIPRHQHQPLSNSRRQPPTAWAEEGPLSKFSLADEARWSSNHRSHAFNSDTKLRFLKVDFVSAGCLEGTIKQKMVPAEPEPDSSTNVAMAHMTLRSASPSPSVSSSSEEEIVFRGRGNTPFTQTTKRSTISSKTKSTPPSKDLPVAKSQTAEATVIVEKVVPIETTAIAEATVLHGTTFSAVEPTPLAIQVTPSASGASKAPLYADSQSDSEKSVVGDAFKKRLGDQTPWMNKTTPWESRSKPGIGWLPVEDEPDMSALLSSSIDPTAAAMEDYMNNIREDLEAQANVAAPGTFAHRDLDLTAAHTDDWHSDGFPVSNRNDDGWNSDTLRDLDHLSTSSDVMDTIERILATRTRKNGIQYLVVYNGSTADDAHWLPADYLKTKGDLDLIRLFEAEHRSRGRQSESIDDSDSGIDDLLNEDEEDEEDEDEDSDDMEDIIGEIDDERMARILQRQEELGLGSEEIVMFAGDDFFDGPVGEINSAVYGFDGPRKKRQHRSIGSSKRKGPSFPSASAMADALAMDPYNGFDVMDTERPSLRPRKKGRRGQPPPELDDSDLNEQMQATWEADRAKKRVKKAEREELRKLGLLGRKGMAPDLSVKYKDGIDMNAVVEEIREFMYSDMQTLSLPPMQANRRAIIHQMVHQIGVTSKSRGDGMNRFTVLSKSSRTKRVDDSFFDALLQRKGLRNRFQNATQRGSGRKTTRPVVSYRDGEKVGANAPELGAENKGRLLLEKMGWTKGTALGALDNKGILQPISHTVKTTKAGLQ